MNMMQNAAAGTIRASLRYPAFRRLLSALAMSQIGDWIHNLALMPPVCSWTHSATWAGAATVARVVPIVVLGPLGGAIADRFDQRLTMLVSDISRLTSHDGQTRLQGVLALQVAEGGPAKRNREPEGQGPEE